MDIEPDIKLWIIPPYKRIWYGHDQPWYLLEAYGRRIWLNPIQGTLVSVALTSVGRKWTMSELIRQVWPYADDQPDKGDIIINSALQWLRKSFAQRDLEFVVAGGRGFQYRIFFGIRPLEEDGGDVPSIALPQPDRLRQPLKLPGFEQPATRQTKRLLVTEASVTPANVIE